MRRIVAAHVALELGLGHARLLEVELVERCVVGLRHHGGRADGRARPERHAEADDAAEAVGTQQRRVPGDRRAPVVAGDHRRASRPARRRRPTMSPTRCSSVYCSISSGAVGLAVAAHVGRHGVEAGLGQRAELVAPGVPGLREAVAEDDERALALLGHVHADAVGLDGRVLHARHGPLRLHVVCLGGGSEVYPTLCGQVGRGTSEPEPH